MTKTHARLTLLLLSLSLSLFPPPALALDIVGVFVPPGQVFPGTSRVATGPGPTIGGGNIQDVFAAAAAAWERHFTDPYTLTINYGWAPVANADGITYSVRTDPVTGRVAEASIVFSTTPFGYAGTWFLDRTPALSEEYAPTLFVNRDLGGGLINTGRWMYAESSPPAIPGIPGGAYSDLWSNALHEIGHALNVNSANLARSDAECPSCDYDVDVQVPPFAGTQIPWARRGGGHSNLLYPNGAMAMHGIFDAPGAHRTLLSDADVLLVAEVSRFDAVVLDGPNISSLTATPNVLWPPNHKMVSVSLAVAATDGIGGTPVCQITAVTSNEPLWVPGETDWVVTGPLTAQLRAERAGSGRGRVYTITVTCTNAVGVSSSKDVTVRVPHDRSK